MSQPLKYLGQGLAYALFAVVLVLGVLALGYLTLAPEATEAQKHERANLNLDAAIVKVKFDRDNVIAGEKVLAEFVVGNTGSDKITNETVEIKAKVLTLIKEIITENRR